MKKNKNNILILIVIIPLVIFGGYVCYDKFISDNKAPVITVDDKPLVISVYDDEDALFEGVTAEDNRDGDLTESVVIEKKTPLSKDGKRNITYAVIDKKGNVGRAERTVTYTGYSKVKFKLSEPIRFAINSNYNLLENIEAESELDGDLTSKIKCLTDFGFDFTEEGTHNLEYSVTDSTGVTTYLHTVADFYDPDKEIYSIELSRYIVYVEKGSSFNPMDYYVGSSSGGSPEIESDVNTYEEGVYNVKYTVGGGDAVGVSRLIVVVTE